MTPGYAVVNIISLSVDCNNGGCPAGFTSPGLTRFHKGNIHGDICRNHLGKVWGLGWTCPSGCVRVEGPPYCKANELSSSPCRVPKSPYGTLSQGFFFFWEGSHRQQLASCICFGDKMERCHGMFPSNPCERLLGRFQNVIKIQIRLLGCFGNTVLHSLSHVSMTTAVPFNASVSTTLSEHITTSTPAPVKTGNGESFPANPHGQSSTSGLCCQKAILLSTLKTGNAVLHSLASVHQCSFKNLQNMPTTESSA